MRADMRVAFLGTADFSVPSLRACSRIADVVTVITQPDRPGSRGRPAPRPVAEAARQLDLQVWQPERLRDPAKTDAVLDLGLDALVVAAYGQILPARLLDGVPLGGINVHASLLPRWRGAAPVAAAILAGDARTGVSIMRMDAGIDTGHVFATSPLGIAPEATTPALTAALADLGAELLGETLPRIAQGQADAVPQPDEGATYAPRLSRSDAPLQWGTVTAVEVDRRVRALNPWPGVVGRLGSTDVHLLQGCPIAGAGSEARIEPGGVIGIDGEGILVACRDGVYRVDQLKPGGGRAMAGAAFLRGRGGR